MAITVQWDDSDKTIVIYTFQSGWKVAEVATKLKEGRDLMAQVNHRVDVIMDFHSAPLFAPSGTFTLATHILQDTAPLNVGATMIVGSAFMNNIFSTVTSISRKQKWKTVFTKSIEEARQKIVEIRALNGLNARV